MADEGLGDRRSRGLDLEAADPRHHVVDNVDAGTVAPEDRRHPLGDPVVARDDKVRVDRQGPDRLGVVEHDSLLSAVGAAGEQDHLRANLVQRRDGIVAEATVEH